MLQLVTINDTETSEQPYLEVIRCKTAALFAAACAVTLSTWSGRWEDPAAEKRAELAELMEQALGDLDLQAQMSELGDHLRFLRPDLPWSGAQRMDGADGLPLLGATGSAP